MAGNRDLIPSWRIKITHATGQLSLCSTTKIQDNQKIIIKFKKTLIWMTFFKINIRLIYFMCLSSVQFSLSVMSDSLQPHELSTTDFSPSPTPRAYSNSCPLSQWCHPTISSSVGPFSSCPQSLPASESFPMSQLFAWGGQNIGISPPTEYSGLISFRIDWLDLLAVQRTLKSLFQDHSSKALILRLSVLL